MALMWFRSDLRINDNAALMAALSKNSNLAVYIATPKQWQQHDIAPIQVDFISRHVKQLAKQLKQHGVTLHTLCVDDYNQQIECLIKFCQEHNISDIYANQEVEYNENIRDQKLINRGLNLHFSECDVIVNKGAVVNLHGEMYKVFTPFSKSWLKHVKTHGIQLSMSAKALAQRPQVSMPDEQCAINANLNVTCKDSSQWPLSEAFKENILKAFFTQKLPKYHEFRDVPSKNMTSSLSPYLAIGAMSARNIACTLIHKYPDVLENKNHFAFTWLNELIWRDFYRHLLFHFPRLSCGDVFNRKYKNMQWNSNQAEFKAWCTGETGYPLVDAAMQQLMQTGWMHNRLRMVVASFLTKHLLIHWQQGERFFRQNLIDGDLAANNGGWQWAASTGCDAQPYFRIFNPILQSKRFDPHGDFIRKYLPELKNVPDKHIHFPHDFIKQHNDMSENKIRYPQAIVEHKFARERALSFFNI